VVSCGSSGAEVEVDPIGPPSRYNNQTDFTVGDTVPVVSEANPVERWQAALEEAGELTPAIVGDISQVHGDRGVRAIEAVGENRVKAYRDFTIVVGYDDEYIVEDGGCTCKDSEYNLDADDPTRSAGTLAGRRDRSSSRPRRLPRYMWYSEVRELL